MLTESTESRIREKIRGLFAEDFSGHDYFHTERVCRNARMLAERIPCDRELVTLAALLHDADDPKLFHTENYENARRIMKEEQISQDVAEQVVAIIGRISFKGDGKTVPESIEGKIVQDADRLDAIGAIGIARAFAYGGSHGRQLYDPDSPPVLHMDEQAYRSNRGSTVNHFYEKLFLLKDLMNTAEAREIAEARTRVMREYMDEFMREWNGEG